MHPTRKPNRLKDYDYSQSGLYFVTSCVQDMVCCFGKIINNKMVLNDYGKIAEQQWYWLAQQYPYVVLHSFVVMPNHMHGIIEIVGKDSDVSREQPAIKIKSISELMGAYKTTSCKKIHLLSALDTSRCLKIPFKWHRSFHDHIIRDELSYFNISYYIENNPANWKGDKFFN